MKKKIAFVIQRYGNEVNGGAEKYTQQVSERLVDYFDIEVLTTCAIDHVTWKNHFKPGKDQLNGVNVLRFPVDAQRDFEEFARLSQLLGHNHIYADRIRDELKYIYAQGPVSFALTDYIRTHRDNYDAFVFLGFIFYPTAVGLQLVPEKSILVPFAHDELITYFKFMKQLFNLPRKILFCSPEERDLVQRISNNHHIESEIVGLGFEVPKISDLPDFREKYLIMNPYILYVGRIEEGKGCKELIQFFRQYKERHPDQKLDLVLIGKSAMEIPLDNDIHYVGFIDENYKFAAMKDALSLIIPSQFESLSMVFMESLLCGTPPIVNGKSEVLRGHCERGNCGLCYENYYEFEGCMEWFSANDTTCLIANGADYVDQNYSWPKITDRFCASINQI